MGKRLVTWLLIVVVLGSVSYFFIKPKAVAAYNIWKGTESLSNNNFNDALVSYSAAIQEDPRAADAYIGRAKTYLFFKQRDAAFADINQAFSIGARSTEAHFVRGVILAGMNHHLLAISEYKVVLLMDPSFHIAQLNIARSYERLNDFPKAITAYNQFIAAVPADDPQLEQAKQLLASTEKKAVAISAAKTSEWKKVAESTSPKTFIGLPVDGTVLEWSSSGQRDIINLKLNEKGWIFGHVSKQHYELIPENENLKNATQKITVSFVTEEKHLSVSQFTANYIAPIRAKPDLSIKMLSSDDKEAYIEVNGTNSYALARVIKGTASIVVLSYGTKNATDSRRSFANTLLRNTPYLNHWPKDGPPQPNQIAVPKPKAI